MFKKINLNLILYNIRSFMLMYKICFIFPFFIIYFYIYYSKEAYNLYLIKKIQYHGSISQITQYQNIKFIKGGTIPGAQRIVKTSLLSLEDEKIGIFLILQWIFFILNDLLELKYKINFYKNKDFLFNYLIITTMLTFIRTIIILFPLIYISIIEPFLIKIYFLERKKNDKVIILKKLDVSNYFPKMNQTISEIESQK